MRSLRQFRRLFEIPLLDVSEPDFLMLVFLKTVFVILAFVMLAFLLLAFPTIAFLLLALLLLTSPLIVFLLLVISAEKTVEWGTSHLVKWNSALRCNLEVRRNST